MRAVPRAVPNDSGARRSSDRGNGEATSPPTPVHPPVHLRVRVMPRASKDALRREADGSLRVWVHAPPVDGAANDAVIALLAARLCLPKSRISLVCGAMSREKVVAIAGLPADEVTRRLGDGASQHA